MTTHRHTERVRRRIFLLTDEFALISVAEIGASHETDQLIEVIDRLLLVVEGLEQQVSACVGNRGD